MKRFLAAGLVSLTLASFLATAPAAEAKAAGVCTISGTINFSPSAPPQGRWDISPGVIECRGFFFGWSPMLGSGSFVASGSYTAVPSGVGCVEQLGSGTVDYWIMTTDQHVHLIEPHSFTLAGAGAFTTPTLRGTFQLPLYDGNCMTTPRTATLFLAQVTLARAGPPLSSTGDVDGNGAAPVPAP
jgi:hypothetical protein